MKEKQMLQYKYVNIQETTCNCNQWIKVSDKLPDNDRYVMLSFSYLKKIISSIGYYSRREGWKISNNNYEPICINLTHWQELPQPPKED